MSDTIRPVQWQQHFQIVDDKNQSIASVTAMRRHGELWLTNLQVDAAHRRTGLATQLMEAAIAELGHQRLYGHAWGYQDRPMNEAQLLAFYARFGFVEKFAGVIVREPDRPTPAPPVIRAAWDLLSHLFLINQHKSPEARALESALKEALKGHADA